MFRMKRRWEPLIGYFGEVCRESLLTCTIKIVILEIDNAS